MSKDSTGQSGAGRSLKRRLVFPISVLVAVAAAALVSAAWPEDSVGGPETARPVVDQYLQALEASDREAVLALAPPGYEAESDVADRLQKYSGRVASANAIVQLTAEVSPSAVTARITTNVGGVTQTWTENVVRHDNSWYMLLGSAPGAVQKVPSSTR